MNTINKKQPPLLFINGWWRNADFYFYRKFVESLGDRDVYNPLYSDCDGKKRFFGFTTFYHHVRDIQDFLTEHGIEHCDLVGFSYGGLVAKYLAKIDKRVRTVTSVASLPTRGVPGRWKILSQLSWKSILKMFLCLRIPYENEKGKKRKSRNSLVSGLVFLQILLGIQIKKLRCPSLAVITTKDKKVLPEIQILTALKNNSETLSVDFGHEILVGDNDLKVLKSVLGWINRWPIPEK